MGHYKSNLRDIEFNLFEVLRRQDIMGTDAFPELDEETARHILDEVNRLATGPLAESFAAGDRHPPVFDRVTGYVTMPEGIKRSFRTVHGLRVVPAGPARRTRRQRCATIARLGGGRTGDGRESGGLDVLGRPALRVAALAARDAGAEALRRTGHRAQVGRDHGADRTGRGLGRGRGPYQGGARSRTGPGTSRASSVSSRAASTT